MPMKQFTLIEKKELTHDVFELHFECNESFEILPGQFVTFILPGIWWRAYSILSQNQNKTVLIIKKVLPENWGRWGSVFICERGIWEVLQWVGPAGHFILKHTSGAKLFIGTGTGLVPLYNQIISWLQRWDTSAYMLLFWVRTSKDLFYLEELKNLSQKYSNFSYQLCLSREETDFAHTGYVTDLISPETVQNFKEAYICGMPAMVDSVGETLHNSWMGKENIFTEKY